MKIAICDLTHLFIDEVKPVAEALDIADVYEKLNGNISQKSIEYYFNKYLIGRKCDWLAEQIKKAEPYNGSTETIEILKSNDYKVISVTDDPLMHPVENKKTIMNKLGIDDIISTSEITITDGVYNSLSGFKTKPEIIAGIIGCYKPLKTIGIVQGKNDISMAEYLKKTGAKVIGVNSNSEKLNNICDYHIDNISEFPCFLKQIDL